MKLSFAVLHTVQRITLRIITKLSFYRINFDIVKTKFTHKKITVTIQIKIHEIKRKGRKKEDTINP